MASARFGIVVGFDCSDGAKRALLWAAEEARLRDATLEVVRARTPGEFGTDEEQAEIAAKQFDADVHAVLGSSPGIELTLSVEQGHAAKILLEHAREANMLVVGRRGHGGFSELLIGSVSHQVSVHKGAAVVVIVRD